MIADICPTCGLPTDLCVCREIEKEQQKIRIRLETRKWGRPTTILEGVTDKNSELSNVTKKLKTFCACGGTTKDSQVILQGDQREKVFKYLTKEGYAEENIELQ